jgi:2-methylcitrate dehydratase PrpD
MPASPSIRPTEVQSNIDGSLAVRMIQGFTSQNGIMAAQLARIGMTGPRNFLDGIYGYFHLYAKDRCLPEAAGWENI